MTAFTNIYKSFSSDLYHNLSEVFTDINAFLKLYLFYQGSNLQKLFHEIYIYYMLTFNWIIKIT